MCRGALPFLFVMVVAATAACSSDSQNPSDAGASADTGAGGGVQAGAGGVGGAPQTGGLGGGGFAMGGAGGAPNSGGAGGAGGAASGGSGGGGASSLDACFAGLRPGEGTYQVATKASADMKYRMRLALETADRFGTSGTRPWAAFRVGLQTPDGDVCITEEAALADAYQGSRHNCSDTLTVTVGNRRYVIANPDTAIDVADPTSWVRPATLSIFVNGQMVGSPIRLETIACHKSSGTPTQCRSGGPC